MEKKLTGACIFGQSGGPTAVINASAYGVIRTALDEGIKVLKLSMLALESSREHKEIILDERM